MIQKTREDISRKYFEEVIFPLNYCQHVFLTQFQEGHEKVRKNFFKRAEHYGVSEEEAEMLVNETVERIKSYKEASEQILESGA